MPVVLDVSAAMSWLVEDERDARARSMARAVADRGGLVPALWRWELRNALLAAERRGRLSKENVHALLSDVGALPIRVDVRDLDARDESELALARRYGLSAYDAAYLELALRTGFPLMTRDQTLGAAANDLQLLWG